MAEEAKEPAKKIDLRWTKKKRKEFIAHLAATYDVEDACRVTGLSWPQVCELRTLHPEFAAAFEEVIAAGYDRLEAMLLRQAGAALAAGDGAGDVTLAATLLRQRRALKTERGKAGAATAGPVSGVRKDELITSIMTKLAPLNIGQARGAYGAGDRSDAARGAGAAGGTRRS